jgi:regulatory protein
MSKVTALREESKERRVRVFLDGRFAFSLDAEVAARENLQVGQELSSAQVEALTRVQQFQRALNAAYRYLSYRPRSEAEIKGRLKRRGFDDDCIGAVMARLKEQDLVDDLAFAQFWKENRESFRPRSQRMTKLELRQKGVAADIIDQVLDEVDDEDSAYRAALARSRHWPMSDYHLFRRRLSEYLRRRGFDYEVISHTVERVWQEREGGSG